MALARPIHDLVHVDHLRRLVCSDPLRYTLLNPSDASVDKERGTDY